MIATKTNKIKSLIKSLLMLPLILLMLPLILIVRIIRPIILIRFNYLRSERIGHFSTNTAMYLCRKKKYEKNTIIDIFYHRFPISNWQMKKMWDRTLNVNKFAKYLDITSRRLPMADAHIVPWIGMGRDIDGLYKDFPIPVSFTEDEEALGRLELRRMGIYEGDSYICFHSRTGNYLAREFKKIDFSYHDFRDSDIDSSFMAMQKMIDRGNFSIRMGAGIDREISFESPLFIDYAYKYRTDFMDIYLGANCKFFVGTSNGLTSIPRLYKKPIAWVNYISMERVHAWDENSMFILKKLWSKPEKRLLKFNEILRSGIGDFRHGSQFEKSGIEIINNRPEEICDLTMEMDDRLNGVWIENDEDKELQQRFWSLYEKNKINKVFRARIGAKFLRENSDLL